MGLEHTTRNALRLVELLGGSVPVYPGASRPIMQKLEHAAEFHGEDGFGNTFMPEPEAKPEKGHAVDFIIETAKAQELCLLTLGPLTNVALAIAKERSLEKRIRHIVMKICIRDSISTVSRVLNKSSYVKKSTFERVEAVISELGYSPNHIARSLSKGTTGIIGAILPDISNPFFPALARGIGDAAVARGYTLILCNTCLLYTSRCV